MGAVLILAPIGADWLFQHNLVVLLTKAPSSTATLTVKLNDLYRFACWITGSLMIGIGILGALMNAREAYDWPASDDDDNEAEEKDEAET